MKKCYFIFFSFIISLLIISAASIVCATDLKRGDILEYGRDKIVGLYDSEGNALKSCTWNGEKISEDECLLEGDRIIVLGFYANDLIKVQFLDGVDYNTYFMHYTAEGIQEDFVKVNEETIVDIKKPKKGDKLEYKGNKILSLYDLKDDFFENWRETGEEDLENQAEAECLLTGDEIIVLGHSGYHLLRVQFLDGVDNNEYFLHYTENVIKDFEPVDNRVKQENQNSFINILMNILKIIFEFITKAISI